jgi:hypothetical protein
VLTDTLKWFARSLIFLPFVPHLSGLEIGSLLETCNLPESSLLVVDSILEEIFLEEKKHEKIVAKLIDMMN